MRHDPADPTGPTATASSSRPATPRSCSTRMLYLTGYGLELDDLEAFRQWDSRTPGHPERHHTPGVEVTTGPLGQGFGNTVGMAIAERALRARFGADVHGPPHLRHRRRRLPAGGHQPRGRVARRPPRPRPARRASTTTTTSRSTATPTLSSPTTPCSALRGLRLARRGPRRDRQRLRRARGGRPRSAMAVEDRPSLLVLRSHIGYPSPEFTDDPEAHGDPFPPRRSAAPRRSWASRDEPFYAPADVVDAYRPRIAERGAREAAARPGRSASPPGPATGPRGTRAGPGPASPGWDEDLPTLRARREDRHPPGRSRRRSTPAATPVPGLVGGAADLTGNTGTKLDGAELQSPEHPGGPPDPLRHPRARHGRRP